MGVRYQRIFAHTAVSAARSYPPLHEILYHDIIYQYQCPPPSQSTCAAGNSAMASARSLFTASPHPSSGGSEGVEVAEKSVEYSTLKQSGKEQGVASGQGLRLAEIEATLPETGIRTSNGPATLCNTASCGLLGGGLSQPLGRDCTFLSPSSHTPISTGAFENLQELSSTGDQGMSSEPARSGKGDNRRSIQKPALSSQCQPLRQENCGSGMEGEAPSANSQPSSNWSRSISQA